MHNSGRSRYLDASWRQSMALAERIVWIEDALGSLLGTPACDAVAAVHGAQHHHPHQTSSFRLNDSADCGELVQALKLEALSYRAYYRSSLEHWLSGNREECYPLDVARLSTLNASERDALQRLLAVRQNLPAPFRRPLTSRRRTN